MICYEKCFMSIKLKLSRTETCNHDNNTLFGICLIFIFHLLQYFMLCISKNFCNLVLSLTELTQLHQVHLKN